MVSPPILIAAGVALVGLVWLLMRSRGGSDRPKSGADKLAEKGDLAGAGKQALSEERYGAAIDYFLRAQQPGNAAYAAARMGDVRRAAELYERAGNTEQAAAYYRRAGMESKADTIEPPIAGRVARVSSIGAPIAQNTAAMTALQTFRTRAARSSGTEAAKGELQLLARDAADALLAEGLLREAAEVYRDADLIDEAVHLFVNVLGSPGEAAPLLARRGHHERAAELYELAGQSERAASSWIDVASAAAEPGSFVDRIERNSEEAARAFLERETRARALCGETVELHYQLGDLLERHGERPKAAEVFQQILAKVGEYRDVAERAEHQVAANDIGTAATELGPGPGRPPAAAAELASKISSAELEVLASQVATAAAEQLRRRGDVMTMLGAAPVRASAARIVTDVVVAGLETREIPIKVLFDSKVAAARVGPSIETLRGFIKNRECDLQNIEVFYRLGLAFVAKGDWDRAREAFDAVEEASPGYRDADARANAIRDWGAALGNKRTQLGTRGVGEKGGRYTISGELGRGGMAVVYRGHDTVLERDVALKFLSEELSTKDDMRALFEREARSAAALNHPNIVTIHDFGVLEGRAFICMEYLEGDTVDDLVEDPGLTIVESLQIAKQSIAALAYAHDHKIIHRDIKPANLMRTPTGLVKVTDFGLAKSTDSTRQSSVIAGTPAFMSPEQLAGRGVDHRTDIFALGVSLYVMLSGETPFEGLKREAPVRLRDHVPGLPEILEAAVMRAIALRRDERFARIEEFGTPIDAVLSAVAEFSARAKHASSVPPPGAGATVSFRGPKGDAKSSD